MRGYLTLNPNAEVKKIMERSSKTEKLKCFEATAFRSGNDIPCFNAGSGLLEQAGNDSYPTYYMDYSPFGSKLFPRRIRSTANGNPELEINVEQLIQGESPEKVSPEIPAGSIDIPTCDAPVPPRAVGVPPPVYPPVAKLNRIEGPVRIVGEVDIQGKFQKAAVDKSPDPLLTEAALKAISNWTYEPAHCNGTKLPWEIEISINFKLR